VAVKAAPEVMLVTSGDTQRMKSLGGEDKGDELGLGLGLEDRLGEALPEGLGLELGNWLGDGLPERMGSNWETGSERSCRKSLD